MWILPLVGYVGAVLGVVFLTLAIGSYYALATLVKVESPKSINSY